MNANGITEKKMKYNPTEREVIFLKAVKELIDEMVNFEIGEIIGSDPHSQFQFCSMTHQKFFNIILVDFLSCSDKRVLGEQSSYLGALKSICKSPNFDKDSSVNNLATYVTEFSDWLEKEIVVKKIWFPSIELETDLSIKRVEFIKICGNISKHNFSRLSGVVREIKLIFDRNKISLNDDEALVIIEEFYDWFHDNIFSYHSSAIAEFLHNIRWGIYEYLQPEFKQSIVYETKEHPRGYHYTYPSNVKKSFAKTCYWELMNGMRSRPYMEKFQVTEHLKKRY